MKTINWKELGKGILFIIICLGIFPFAIGTIMSHFSFEGNSYVYIANSINYLCILALLVGYYFSSLKEDLKKFAKNWQKNLKLACFNWLKAFVFMIICNVLLLQIIGNIAENEEANRMIISNLPIFSIITMVFVGPFIEELLFRKGFRKAFSSKKQFLFFTAILFGFGHIIVSLDFSLNALLQCLYMIPYAGIGYFFADAYYESDSIFTSFLMHMFHNGLMISILLLAGSIL